MIITKGKREGESERQKNKSISIFIQSSDAKPVDAREPRRGGEKRKLGGCSHIIYIYVQIVGKLPDALTLHLPVREQETPSWCLALSLIADMRVLQGHGQYFSSSRGLSVAISKARARAFMRDIYVRNPQKSYVQNNFFFFFLLDFC